MFIEMGHAVLTYAWSPSCSHDGTPASTCATSASASVDLWETTYHQVLDGPDPLLEWMRGTALRPYLSALGGEDAAAFEATYAALLREAYPPSASGETLFPFKRLFVVASVNGPVGGPPLSRMARSARLPSH